MFYESLIILNISTPNFSEGVPASVLVAVVARVQPILLLCTDSNIDNYFKYLALKGCHPL